MNVTATLLGQVLTFAILVWFIMRFLWEPLTNLMEVRKTKIADGLAAAEHGLHDRELAEKRAKELLHEAKGQASEIVNQAKSRATEIIDEAKGDAIEEGSRLLLVAQSEIEQEKNRAREQLRSQVTKLALAAAEKILQREIDLTSHQKILDNIVKELG